MCQRLELKKYDIYRGLSSRTIARLNSGVFITSAKRCLLDTGNLELASSTEVSEAALLLDTWLDVVPKSHKEMDAWLQQANAITYLALAPIKLGKSNG
jgi:hypothetical protein